MTRCWRRKPGNGEALNNRGNALNALGRDQEAMASLDAAVAAEPGNPLFWYNRGNLLLKLKHLEPAIADFDKVLALQPGHATALGNRGGALVSLGRADLALADFDAVLAREPRNFQAMMNRASALMHLQRHAEALAAYDQVLALSPREPRVLGQVAIAAMHECDWPRMAALTPAYHQAVREKAEGLDPLTFISYGGEGAALLQSARTALTEKLVPTEPLPLWTGQRYNHQRLRIAYVSADLHGHPVGYLMAPLLERHDRTRFEITVISTGQADGGTVRARIQTAADQFHDMGQSSDRDVAEKLRELEIDIAVDLHGHTYGGRFGAFAMRPAPVQVTWLGFPGSAGEVFERLTIVGERDGAGGAGGELGTALVACAVGDSDLKDVRRSVWNRSCLVYCGVPAALKVTKLTAVELFSLVTFKVSVLDVPGAKVASPPYWATTERRCLPGALWF